MKILVSTSFCKQFLPLRVNWIYQLGTSYESYLRSFSVLIVLYTFFRGKENFEKAVAEIHEVFSRWNWSHVIKEKISEVSSRLKISLTFLPTWFESTILHLVTLHKKLNYYKNVTTYWQKEPSVEIWTLGCKQI